MTDKQKELFKMINTILCVSEKYELNTFDEVSAYIKTKYENIETLLEKFKKSDEHYKKMNEADKADTIKWYKKNFERKDEK